MALKLLFTFLLFVTILVNGQTMSCNISTLTPTSIYYAGPANSYTTFSPPAIHYLCPSAVLYDTLAPGDRDVMINNGSTYYWTPCGVALSHVFIKGGGTLNLKQAGCPTGIEIYIEPGAIVNDPFGIIGTTAGTFTCSLITFPSINCSVGVQNLFNSELVFSVSPNPASDALNITYLEQTDFNLEVIDCFGKCVMEARKTATISVSSLSSGLFLLRLSLPSGETKTARFIKH